MCLEQCCFTKIIIENMNLKVYILFTLAQLFLLYQQDSIYCLNYQPWLVADGNTNTNIWFDIRHGVGHKVMPQSHTLCPPACGIAWTWHVYILNNKGSHR